MARRNDIDWEAVERDYRAGQLTVAQMADKHGVSTSQIKVKAKDKEWQRDLSSAIKARAKAKISQIDVQALVEAAASEMAELSAKQSAMVQQSAIEQAADVAAGIVMSHRKHYSKVKTLAADMLEEVAEFGREKESINKLCQIIGQDDPLAAQAIKRVTGFSGRVQSLEKLANTLVKIADAERKAFGIDDEEKGGTTIEDLLDKLPLR